MPEPDRPATDSLARPLEIDGARVARAFGLDVGQFRQLMDDGKIAVLCERGTGEDAGCFRVSFYYGNRRARFVVDSGGQPLPATPP